MPVRRPLFMNHSDKFIQRQQQVTSRALFSFLADLRPLARAHNYLLGFRFQLPAHNDLDKPCYSSDSLSKLHMLRAEAESLKRQLDTEYRAYSYEVKRLRKEEKLTDLKINLDKFSD